MNSPAAAAAASAAAVAAAKYAPLSSSTLANATSALTTVANHALAKDAVELQVGAETQASSLKGLPALQLRVPAQSLVGPAEWAKALQRTGTQPLTTGASGNDSPGLAVDTSLETLWNAEDVASGYPMDNAGSNPPSTNQKSGITAEQLFSNDDVDGLSDDDDDDDDAEL